MKIDRKSVSKKIEQNEPIIIRFNYAEPELLMFMNSILAKMLAKIDHQYLLNSAITILREIVVNAIKANSKRVYFIKNGLDIQNPEQYEKGMMLFKKNVIGEFDAIKDDMEKSDYFVELDVNLTKDDLLIRVSNNCPIMPEELERINFRIDKAKKYNDFSEAYEEVDDDTEGAGLGIVLTILFLKNMGINPDSYKITSNKGLTQTFITIPKDLKPVEVTSKLKTHIVDEIEGVPTFPDNIIQLQRLCLNPQSSIDDITKRISMDPALVTDVLKLSNSAGFIQGKRIDSISTAVMTIGLKNVNAILTASNARRILSQRYKHYEQIWIHCNKTAFYARTIALTAKMTAQVENAFLAGLLHDLGKIILLATDMNLVEKISGIVKERKMITSTVMEEISIGVSHSEIGGLIALKWKFPEYLVDAISYHHAPLSASPDNRDLLFAVYLANMLCGIEDRKYNYFYIEEEVLERFNILDEIKFKDFHEKMKLKFEDQKKFL